MKILDRFRKKKEGLPGRPAREDIPGAPFVIQLLFEESCPMPEKERMNEVMQKRLGEVENLAYDERAAVFTVKRRGMESEEGEAVPHLIIAGCEAFDASGIGETERGQMWNCEGSSQLLNRCRYQVAATDLMAEGLPFRERARMDMDFLEALVELYPTCQGVYFKNSGKLWKAEEIRGHQIPEESRFLYFAVNVRCFRGRKPGDMLVDSLGMSLLFLPDLQYCFRGMEPEWVMNHAYQVLSYLYDRENPIRDGDPVDGIVNGAMSREVQWICRYGEAVVPPVRGVIDITMNEYASKKR